MAWPTLRGSNPFDETGLSREVASILDFLAFAKAHGADVVVTSTTDHPDKAASGATSNHRKQGTGGRGLALDCRTNRVGDNIHASVARLFVPVIPKLSELIYSGTDGPIYVKHGKRVAPFAVDDHRNHVHGALPLGTFLTAMAPPTPTPDPGDDDMAMIVEFDHLPPDAQGQRPFVRVKPDGSTYANNGAPEFKTLAEMGGGTRSDVVGAHYRKDAGGVEWLDLFVEQGSFTGDSPTYSLERR